MINLKYVQYTHVLNVVIDKSSCLAAVMFQNTKLNKNHYIVYHELHNNGNNYIC